MTATDERGPRGPEARRQAIHRVLGDSRTPVVVLGAFMLGTAVVLLSLQRGMTFLVDEWIILDERRDWDVDTFLDPLYEHFSLVPILVFKVLMSTVGIEPHVAYVIPLIALHLACVALVYVLGRARLGPWFALAPAALVLFLGSAYDSLLLPVQISFLGSVAAGLGVLVALDPPASRGRAWLAMFLLLVSLASSGVGLVFVVAALVEILARPGWRSRIWIVVVPVVVYGMWYALYGSRGLEQGSSVQSNAPDVPRHVAESAAALAGAMSGLGIEWGRVLAAIVIVGVAAAWLRGASPSARALAASVALASFWVLGGLARAHQDNAPEASRYLYPGAILAVVIGIEALRFVELDRRWAALLAAFVAVAAVGNAAVLRGAKNTHLMFSREISAQFAALETLGRTNVDGEFVPGIYLAPTVEADAYFAMVDELGSPVDVRRDILARGETERRIADRTLATALARPPSGPWSVGTSRPSAPRVEKVEFGTAKTAGACLMFDASEPGSAVSFNVPEAALRVRAASTPVRLSLRRFGEAYQTFEVVSPRSQFTFPVPGGGLTERWHLRAASRDRFSVCAIDPADA